MNPSASFSFRAVSPGLGFAIGRVEACPRVPSDRSQAGRDESLLSRRRKASNLERRRHRDEWHGPGCRDVAEHHHRQNSLRQHPGDLRKAAAQGRRNRIGTPPPRGGSSSSPSSLRKAARMSARRMGRSMPGISRNAGQDSTANMSDAHFLRGGQRGVVQDVFRISVVGGGMVKRMEVAGVGIRIGHGSSPFLHSFQGTGFASAVAAGSPPPQAVRRPSSARSVEFRSRRLSGCGAASWPPAPRGRDRRRGDRRGRRLP